MRWAAICNFAFKTRRRWSFLFTTSSSYSWKSENESSSATLFDSLRCTSLPYRRHCIYTPFDAACKRQEKTSPRSVDDDKHWNFALNSLSFPLPCSLLIAQEKAAKKQKFSILLSKICCKEIKKEEEEDFFVKSMKLCQFTKKEKSQKLSTRWRRMKQDNKKWKEIIMRNKQKRNYLHAVREKKATTADDFHEKHQIAVEWRWIFHDDDKSSI